MNIDVRCTFYNKLVIILLFYLNNIIFPVSQGISSYIWPTSKVSSLQKNCPSIAFVCNSTIHGGNIHLVLDISDFTASVMMLTKLCLRSSKHKSLLQPGGRGNIVVGSRQDSPQDQDPHRQGLETLPLTYSPLLSSDPPPAWPRPPPPSPPTQPPRPPCVCVSPCE